MVKNKPYGARLHRFVYGFFAKSDRQEAEALYRRVEQLLASNRVRTQRQIEEFSDRIANEVIETLNLSEERNDEVRQFVSNLVDHEALFSLPDIDFRDSRSVSEYWELSDELKALKIRLEKFTAICDALTDFTLNCFSDIDQQLGEVHHEGRDDGITVSTARIDRVADLARMVELLAVAPFQDQFDELGLFTRLRQRLETNFVIASGGTLDDVHDFSRTFRMPSEYKAKSPRDLVTAYLSGTPMLQLFGGEEVFVIPQWARFEHHHIIAGSGHGKTQTLQYLIAEDLKAVERGERSVIVIDSQGDLINKISNLAVFAPGEPLHDRIVIIDPTDVEWPVSLNLFDVGRERLDNYSQLERERLTNSILELYDFVLGSLLSAEMTQKQNVIFRYVTRLMLHIPDATIHTLRELMEEKSEQKFAEHIRKLQGTARHFFDTEFTSREFEQTKKQVLRRLWGILENQTFERMFSHPRSKLDLYAEMNAGKVILINTAKDLLKEQGTEIFGRFFIALIAQAAQERATMPEHKRMPTMVYIDEAADYFDRNIGIILSQARKYNVGMVLAHQYLGQLEPKLQEAFAANTSIKFAGGVSSKDARSLAPMMSCDAAMIEAQPKGSFAASIRGVSKAALSLKFPLGHMEDLDSMSYSQREDLQTLMRSKFAVHYKELMGEQPPAGMPSDELGAGDERPKPNGGKDPDDPDIIDTDPSPDF